MNRLLLMTMLLACTSLISYAQPSPGISIIADYNGTYTSGPITNVPFCTSITFTAALTYSSDGGFPSTECSAVAWYDQNNNLLGYGGTLTISITANINVHAYVYLGNSGCTSTQGYSSNTISITAEAQDIHIDGPLQVCTSAQTFIVRNLPAGTSISWSVTGNIEIIGSNNTPSIQVEALNSSTSSGTVSATVGTVCGYNPGTLHLNVVTGPQTPTSINGITNGQTFAPNTSFAFSDTYGNNWLVYNGTILSGQGTNYIIVQTASDPSGSQIPFQVQVREDDACGVSPYYYANGYIESGGGGGHIVIHPNPTSGTVTLSSATGTTAPASKTAVTSVSPGIQAPNAAGATMNIRLIKIYDATGRLRKLIENKAASMPFSFDVSDLGNGVYFVEMLVGNNVERQKLVVRH